MDDVDEVVSASHNKKPGKLIEPRKVCEIDGFISLA